MAAVTRRWSGESRLFCAARNASPWRRKISATSSAGRTGSQLLGRDHLEREAIEWTWRAGDQAGGDLGVTDRRLQVAVAGHHLDDANVGPTLQKVGGKAVLQRVGGHMLADRARFLRCAAGCLESSGADRFWRY